jgi:pyroglutamyl-peptidase
MKHVLVTGFGAYAEESQNPSGLIAERLDGHVGEGVQIHGRVLAVGTNLVEPALAAAIEEVAPDVVVITGVTPGRAAPAVERVAINVRDFPIVDVEGHMPIDEPVAADGPPAYFSTLPTKAILARWREDGIPGYLSNTAGTYVCNQTFYLARHLTRSTTIRAGLVHIPSSTANAVASLPPPPALPLDVLERAVRLAALVAATHDGADLRFSAGATS